MDNFADISYFCNTKISVIVAFRNEEGNLNSLLKSFEKQEYPAKLFEIIFVNDHSDDNGVNIIENYKLDNIKILHLEESKNGKKAAIDKGIKASNGELIVTTDADCIFNENWLSTIVSFYEKEKSDMIIAPVVFEKQGGFLYQFQYYDFLALMASTAGACRLKMPIMNNGANLAYKKETYLELHDATKTKIASGDDMFLLINMKQKNKKIQFLNSVEALVNTKSEMSFNQFINQRIRWAGKNKNHSDFHILSIGFVVLLFNLSLITMGILSIWSSTLFFSFLLILITKTIIEYVLISFTASALHQKIRLYTFFFLQPFHIIYISLIPILSLFTKYKWKDRKIRV